MTTTLKADYTPRAIERRKIDRERVAKLAARHAVITNFLMFCLGVLFALPWFFTNEEIATNAVAFWLMVWGN